MWTPLAIVLALLLLLVVGVLLVLAYAAYRVPLDGAEQIARERQRQIDEEGYAELTDAHYVFDELALAAACYALPPRFRTLDELQHVPVLWPWHAKHWKPVDRKRDLVRAGALIAAEIDRIDLAEARYQARRAEVNEQMSQL